MNRTRTVSKPCQWHSAGRRTASWMVKPQQWHRLCFHAAEGVIWTAKPSSWIYVGSDCWGNRNTVHREPLLSLWCRAAWLQPQAACFTLWLTIVPALPFIQGASLSLSAGLKALFLVGTESELRDIQYFTTSLLSGMLCQTFSYVFIYIYYFQKTETMQKNSRQEKRSQRKMWQQCAWVTWRTFKNILLQKGNHQLQPCFWQMRLEK